MSVQLNLYSAASNGEPVAFATLDGGENTIGREPENAIVVESSKVSRQHGSFTLFEDQWIFVDFNSTNGSWLNGHKVLAGRPKILRENDKLQLADVEMTIGLENQDTHPFPSVLVFEDEQFLGEIPIRSDEQTVVGGEGGAVPVPAKEPILALSFDGNRLEMHSLSGSTIRLNGMTVGGDTSLGDRDEISFEDYILVINALGVFRATSAAMKIPGRAHVSALSEAHGPVQHPLMKSAMERGWDTEGAKWKEAAAGFVFGVGQRDPANMMGEDDQHVGGSEMSFSQKLTPITDPAEEEPNRRFINLILILVVSLSILLLGALIYAWKIST